MHIQLIMPILTTNQSLLASDSSLGVPLSHSISSSQFPWTIHSASFQPYFLPFCMLLNLCLPAHTEWHLSDTITVGAGGRSRWALANIWIYASAASEGPHSHATAVMLCVNPSSRKSHSLHSYLQYTTLCDTKIQFTGYWPTSMFESTLLRSLKSLQLFRLHTKDAACGTESQKSVSAWWLSGWLATPTHPVFHTSLKRLKFTMLLMQIEYHSN